MFTLPDLPYSTNALEPVIDTQTMTIHHTKHHQWYINNLNAWLEQYPDYQSRSLEDLLTKINDLPDQLQSIVRKQGGWHANHSLFWTIMRPVQEDNKPTWSLAHAIDEQFGSFEAFKEKLSTAAASQFGSGRGWLVKSGNSLEILATANQDSPLMDNKTPLLGVDVREHAYYLHYQNRRPDYLKARWELVNWEKVEELYNA